MSTPRPNAAGYLVLAAFGALFVWSLSAKAKSEPEAPTPPEPPTPPKPVPSTPNPKSPTRPSGISLLPGVLYTVTGSVEPAMPDSLVKTLNAAFGSPAEIWSYPGFNSTARLKNTSGHTDFAMDVRGAGQVVSPGQAFGTLGPGDGYLIRVTGVRRKA